MKKVLDKGMAIKEAAKKRGKSGDCLIFPAPSLAYTLKGVISLVPP